MNRVYGTVLLALGILLAGCTGPPAIAREGWTLIDVLTTSERSAFQSETVDVRNCGVPERKSTSCAAGSSASFSVGAQAQAGAEAGVVVANLDVSVGASTAFELGFDRSSGEELNLETPPDGFVNRYWVEKEFRIITGEGRVQHKDGVVQDGIYTLRSGCFLRIVQLQILTCEAVAEPSHNSTPAPLTNPPTPVAVEPAATTVVPGTTPTPRLTLTEIPTRRPPTPIPISTSTPTLVASISRFIDGIEYVQVPAGEFTMGSTEAQVDTAWSLCKRFLSGCSRSAFADEMPQHRVYLDEYWIMKTEVSNAQFQVFLDAGGYNTQRYWVTEGWKWRGENNITHPGEWTNNHFNAADQPVVSVSWYEAAAYAVWLSEITGLSLRLPTEAEWEKAARGPDGRLYPWGDKWDGSQLNYCDAKCIYYWKDKNVSDGYQYTSPVGSYLQGISPNGALDLAGNAWEWTNDLYGSYSHATSLVRSPQGPTNGNYRVLRGGAWNDNPSDVRVAGRDGVEPVYRYRRAGFRLVVSGS